MFNENYIQPQENRDDILSQAAHDIATVEAEILSNDEELKAMTPKQIDAVLQKSIKSLRSASHFSVSEHTAWVGVGDIQ